MKEQTQDLPTALTASDLIEKIKRVEYVVMPKSTTTVCQLHLENGYTVIGTSACIDPRRFNKATGEHYAYEDAVEKLWELEGYLLKQRRFEAGIKDEVQP
jgi:hypothetical protein